MVEAPAGPEAETLARGWVVDRYTILALAGRGGMGQVYAAYDAKLDRKVALKLLQGHHEAGDTQGRARMLREARALAKLSHPNVVAVHDVGTFRGRVFVAMEYIDGVTLKDWLAERPRGREEILAAFTQAAAGLAAAHAAGLVHRDFKPANVMIARNGDVRVTDFGLARPLGGDGEPSQPGARTSPDAGMAFTLSDTGPLAGTPRYMSPEQFRAEATDARSDQFSFCVALYEALYGASPFGDGEASTLASRVLAGRVEAPPAKSNVPSWMRAVLLRGLAVSPDARWPSMDALVAALGRDPARAHRRLAAATGISVLVGLSVLTLARGVQRPAELCTGGAARLTGVWEPAPQSTAGARRAAVRAALLASGAPGPEEVWARVASVLDRYAAGWLAMHDDACQATHVRHAQTEAVLDLRMACLDQRRTSLAALTDVLSRADREVASNAAEAANSLPDLARCADVDALQAPFEQPRDEATRKRADDLRRRAAPAKALNDTGKRREALTLIKSLIAEARGVGYRPLLAELLTIRGRIQNGANFAPEVVGVAEEAVWLGLASGRDDLAAEAAVALVTSTGYYQPRPAEGWRWSRLARSILERTGGNHDLLLAWLLQNEGNVDQAENHFEQALGRYQQSVALKKRVLPPDHPDIAHGLNAAADVMHTLGKDPAETLAINAEALRLFEHAYGRGSAEVCMVLGNRGQYLVASHRSDEALPVLRESLDCWLPIHGADHPFNAYPLTDLGRALLAPPHPRPAEAVRALEHAVRIREGHDPDSTLVAESRFALARALWEADGDRARARNLAAQARNAYTRSGDAQHADEVTAWLSAHGAAPTRHR